jgi:2-oxoglutarate dehydrogenase E1 component
VTATLRSALPPPRLAAGAGEREALDAVRRWGYLQARLDPLGRLEPRPHPELDAARGEAAEAARRIYCGAIGAEFMHLSDPERRTWVAAAMEAEPPAFDRRQVLERLLRAEIFEQVLQTRYLGSKRFSIEGVTALIPLLDEMGRAAAGHGAKQVVLAMSHRGRLNVMLHVTGIPAAHLFAGFEDVDPRSVLGGGDVKYHMGATGYHPLDPERRVKVHLVSNPSHLEAVHPVALGRTRAKQRRFGEAGRFKVVAMILHGDAAFAGQGVAAEALNLSEIPGYEVGGAVHVVVNNLLGFTTEPWELHSSRFATSVARRLEVPIFHVNGEDLPAVVRAGRMALDYRHTFGTDVVVDLIGYRRHGHSEVDDPTITQPLLYRRIAEHPPLYELYAAAIGVGDEEVKALVERVKGELAAAQEAAARMEKKPPLHDLPPYWAPYRGGRYDPADEVETGLAEAEVEALGTALTAVPEGFHAHPKIAKLLEQRREMAAGERAVDFGMAEALAFASLVKGGVPVRLSGQDSARGTFAHRHSLLRDVDTDAEYRPLDHVAPGQAPFEVYNSILSEAAVLGFEYGYSRDFPEALVLWEAQFGDFANGAQVIIDQFVAAAEDKWKLLSGLVLLLPHGYEGQGPEHSSARIERYLQLAAEDNFQVCQPATAAQYFHLLRRQALRPWRKPLVVFTPKSMLRHPLAASPREDLSRERFLPVLPDRQVTGGAKRVLLCSGKIRHELGEERKRRGVADTAILSIEQLYPFPARELAAALAPHRGMSEVVWVQEEPGNMGPHFYVLPRIEEVAREVPVRSIKRSPSASPATGSAKAHQLEQKTLLTLAFTTREERR